jgi:HEAT repeat protein
LRLPLLINKMSGMSISELTVAQAVHQALHTAAEDEERRWDLVVHLHNHGGQEALDVALAMREHAEPSHRTLAADILSQLGGRPGQAAIDGPFRDEALAALLAMIDGEHDPQVLYAITVGFGHIGDERCVEPLIRLHAHADTEVRSGVVFGLLGRPETAALQTLIILSADSDSDVRDWATFGLARQTDQDFPQLREALADRLADDDPDTFAEAVHGLATRGDIRAVAPMLDALQAEAQGSDPHLVTEALYALAAATGDLRLLPHLLADLDSWLADALNEDPPEELQAALARYAEINGE